MDTISIFRHESAAFEQAIRQAAEAPAAPLVPSCPEWSAADLTFHLGAVHRLVARLLTERSSTPPDPTELSFLDLPAGTADWPPTDRPAEKPFTGPVAASLVDWFAAGAAALGRTFADTPADARVWTYGADPTAAFWLRVQAIEVSLHRWDAEGALGRPAAPLDAELAVDAVAQNFEVMAPFRRAMTQAPPGAGECYRLRRTDGPQSWTVRFDGEAVQLAGEGAGEADVELAGTASDLVLFLWGRLPADRLEVRGDEAVLARYFTLVPQI
ncbi:maleylpyruvate isomerase family mycothiol-dependent enzyme [Kitasatospora sp. NPDC006697]|uniref:maleylpyruvate isomerase family mycothiol-dependent enzyme n=1 Tax=Kitasatospora sp. NPDC006697 TaxID=3364020 RepID=UPI0036BDB69B